MYRSEEFGTSNIPVAPFAFLYVSNIYEDKYLFEEALQHTVGKRPAMDEQLLTPKLNSIITQQISAQRDILQSVRAKLMALCEDSENTPFHERVAQAYFRTFLEDDINFNDPLDSDSYRTLRNFANPEHPLPMYWAEQEVIDAVRRLERFVGGKRITEQIRAVLSRLIPKARKVVQDMFELETADHGYFTAIQPYRYPWEA